MLNVVFEGSTGTGKTTIIQALKNKLIKDNLKVGFTNDIDQSSPLYKVINDMFQANVLVTSSLSFNTLRYETLIQAADYLYLREKLYSQNNDINLFDRNYMSIYNYQKSLLKGQIEDDEIFMSSILNCLKSGEKPIDLLIFFDHPIKTSLKRSQTRDKRKYSDKEIQMLTKFNEELKDYIRINNHEYCLLALTQKETIQTAVDKIYQKIKELLADKQKTAEDKWAELYRIDIEEFPTPDDYITYKLKYKKKFIKKIMEYSNQGKVIEAGCGTGLMAGYLQKLGCEVTAIDISQKILDLAKEIAEQSSVIAPCTQYEKKDILNLDYQPKTFNASVSNGALEHFSDKDIIKTLKEQMKIADYVLFGVPSPYFTMNEKMLGNERSLNFKEWKNLIEQAGGVLVEFNDFHYYKYFRRLFEIKKWFKPKAFWLFIIKEKENGGR